MRPIRTNRIACVVSFLLMVCGMAYGGEVYPLPDGRCPEGHRPVTRKVLREANAEGEGGVQEEEYYTVCIPLTEQQLRAQKEAQAAEEDEGDDDAVKTSPPSPSGDQAREPELEEEEPDPDAGAQTTSSGASVNLEASIEIVNDSPYKIYTNMDYRRRIIIVSSKNDSRFNKWWVLNYKPQVFKDVPVGTFKLYCNRDHIHTFRIGQGERVKYYAQGCRLTSVK